MPYDSIDELPEDQTDQYSKKQKKAFMKAFNSAVDDGKEEERAFKIAHGAAKKAGD